VQIGEAEAVGVIDDDRIDGGNIQAAFDDRGADQDIGLAAKEFEHDPFQLPFVHLAVADDEFRLRHCVAQFVG